MKKLVMIPVLAFLSTTLFAQNYTATDASSAVTFTIKNFGLSVDGSFKGLQGKIIFDPANLSTASVNVTMDATTVSTGNGSRDRHLKKEDYFDVANHPRLSFVSTSIIAAAAAGTYTMQGSLTIKGVSKAVSFPFTATVTANGYRFAGKFRINRRDFNVGAGSWILSDELTISFNISAIK